MVPGVGGDVDGAYVVDALRRGGSPDLVSSLQIDDLAWGRTSSTFKRLCWHGEVGRSSAILKILPAQSWRNGAMDGEDWGEAGLFLAGVTRDLPAGLESGIIDLARHRSTGDWWMLMRDVSPGIRLRGEFSPADERALLQAVARLHARYWDSPQLRLLPIASMRATTQIWADPLVTLVRGARALSAAPRWIREFLDDFELMGVLLPRFLELLSPEDADFVVDLARFRHWEARLDEGPQTLVHGDLQRANISMMGDRVVLLDWEFAARGPAATDLVWHWFHHFWAYPSPGADPEQGELLKEYYLDNLEHELGQRVDRESFEVGWDIGWLRILVQIGYLLADGVYGDLSSKDLARVRMKCHNAVAYAREICNRQLP